MRRVPLSLTLASSMSTVQGAEDTSVEHTAGHITLGCGATPNHSWPDFIWAQSPHAGFQLE